MKEPVRRYMLEGQQNKTATMNDAVELPLGISCWNGQNLQKPAIHKVTATFVDKGKGFWIS